ncbi:PLP-dependent aminotransferase family protein [Taibaiella chishuiensis]|uniref:GntR family transcriptional regulator/MocR family aminotransferase n=1 Tax=Taibaiella chishuiensis TaxID=1434707 RepID=A0A2P8DBM5_9BACT|nr:PLP-dependent aminotransferase family protein [Taibaiella chishuiensis]PSK94631.1 GntR family transcriptional regulator/MocR family aminotransferase [Taibaiella chishuiensis]
MLPYKNLLAIDKSSHTAVFKQIALHFIRLIQEGKLLPGTELPSTRILATDLGLHRKTITAAYDYLVAGNWLDSLPRKGFIVSPQLPVTKPRSYHNHRQGGYNTGPGFSYEQFPDFSYPASVSRGPEIVVDDGFPDISLLPADAMLKEYRRALEYPMLKKISSGWELEGSADFRSALCGFLTQTRGLDIRVEHLLTTRGAQMAIYVAAALIIKPGDKVIVSDPSYFFANMIFENLGAELIRIPVDDQGMRTDMVEEVLKTQAVKLLYVIPHHHHPTTVTLGVERRNHLLQLVRNYQLAVIEDDYDYDFQFQSDPYLPLASGHHEGNIIYIGSLTKVLGTPFRLGYIVAAEKFIHAAARKRILIDLRGDVFSEQVVAGLIENGDLTRLIQKANKLYCQRCDYLGNLLSTTFGETIEFKKPDGGMAMWLQFKPGVPLEKVIARAASRGLRIAGTVYHPGKGADFNAFRFGFASLDTAGLEKAVDILQAALRLTGT